MYCTVEHLKKKLSEVILANLSSDSGDGVVNESFVESILTEKSDYIDNTLRGRYSLPLTKQHTILQEICADLATAALYGRRQGSKKQEELKAMIDYAEQRLRGLQTGSLVLDEGSTQEHSKPFAYRSAMPERTYTPSLLSQMRG